MRRLGYLCSPGGLRAAFAWLITKLFRVQWYAFLALPRDRQAARKTTDTNKFQYLTFASTGNVETARETWLAQLNARAGAALNDIVESGGSVHALVDGDMVVCQLTIRRAGGVEVDTPVLMKILYPNADCFLQYFFTSTEYRRQGAGAMLLATVSRELCEGTTQRLLTHVSMTNVPSLNAFEKAGWRRLGWIVTSRRGRLLWERGLTAAGIRIEVERTPPSPRRRAEIEKIID